MKSGGREREQSTDERCHRSLSASLMSTSSRSLVKTLQSLPMLRRERLEKFAMSRVEGSGEKHQPCCSFSSPLSFNSVSCLCVPTPKTPCPFLRCLSAPTARSAPLFPPFLPLIRRQHQTVPKTTTTVFILCGHREGERPGKGERSEGSGKPLDVAWPNAMLVIR